MIQRTAKIDANKTQLNFQASKEISYWAKRYHTSLEEIQNLFADCRNSIPKTLEILRKKQKFPDGFQEHTQKLI